MSEFEFLAPLEENWRTIQREAQGLREAAYAAWTDEHLYELKDGWKVFVLYGFGSAREDSCKICPETTRLVEAIPGLTMAGFSRLAPGTHIRPHGGFRLGVFRCHLGLVVPEACGIRVRNESAVWQEGRCIVFDDTNTHEAWNHSEGDRIVLLVDFKKDPEGFNPYYAGLRRLVLAKHQLESWLSRRRRH